MNPQEKSFLQVEEELESLIPLLSEAIDKILEQDVTLYPIFIAHQQELALGLPFINHLESDSPYSIHVSSLEELNGKQVIPNNKVEAFKEVYKDPEDWVCVLYVGELGQQFLFLPRLS
jgi:hypothetical protein